MHMDYITFFTDILNILADFLMQEPICYFIGIILLCFIVKLADFIMHGRRGKG